MSFFSFILTEKCNWKCSYCEYPLMQKPNTTTKKILDKHMPYIMDMIINLGKNVTGIDVQGGEVGLIDLNILRVFFKYIPFPVIISTNGKFLERGYNNDKVIRPLIKEIYYHVYPDPKKVKIEYKKYDDKIPIKNGIVHNNIEDMIDFIRINENIFFDYIEFENPIYSKTKISVNQYHVLIDKVKNFPNISSKALNILKRKIEKNTPKREFCRKFSSTVTIDLVNERILLCHRSNSSYIHLSKTNLKKRLTSYPKDIFSIDNCKSCVRLYSRWSSHEFEDPIKARKYL